MTIFRKIIVTSALIATTAFMAALTGCSAHAGYDVSPPSTVYVVE
jgi:hypothetical protein